MRTAYKALIAIVVVIIIGLVYIAFTTPLNCDSTTTYDKVDATTGADIDGIQCYCPTDITDSNGNPQASWVQQNDTQYYNCVLVA